MDEALVEALQEALPEGFVLHRSGAGLLACRGDTLAAIEASGLGIEGRHTGARRDRIPDAEESGREPLGHIVVAGTGCLVRRFTHGGLMRRVTGRRFLDASRPFVELSLSELLRTAGIPTPPVVAARAVSVAPTGYELTLVTERVPDMVDVGALLGKVRRGEAPPIALRRAIEASARVIRRMHDIGFVHADLQPANVLVPRGIGIGPAPELATVLDLDRSKVEGAPLRAERGLQNLGRLWRHVRRRESQYGAVLSRSDLVRFLRAYGAPRDQWLALANGIDEAAESRRGLHRVGWWLERRFGRRDDARAAGHSASTTRG